MGLFCNIFFASCKRRKKNKFPITNLRLMFKNRVIEHGLQIPHLLTKSNMIGVGVKSVIHSQWSIRFVMNSILETNQSSKPECAITIVGFVWL